MPTNNDYKVTPEQELIIEAMQHPHPRTSTPLNVVVLLLCGVLGSIIGMETMVNLGSCPNTSIIGALIAVIIGYMPFKLFSSYKSIHTQNLIETGISASTFGAGNVMFYALAVMWLLGLHEYMLPMIIGAAIGLVLDVSVLYWNFDTPLLPASKSWPLGIATAETILSAAEKGKKAIIMLCGTAVGAVGAFFSIPTDIMGICFFGNFWALIMFCAGLTIRGYIAPELLHVNINDLYIPHGVMLGAGVAALVQIAIIVKKGGKRNTKKEKQADAPEQFDDNIDQLAQRVSLPDEQIKCTRTSADLGRGMTKSFLLFIVGAVIIAVTSGLISQMPFGQLVWWCIYAAIAALVSELMCGIASMNAGWFPGTATVLLFLVIGLFFDFPILGLGLLVGYTSSTGPAFSDMGYDLKCGWILRGKGANPKFELEGRREQYYAELMGCAVAVVVSVISYTAYFSANRFPPVASTFVATINAGSDSSILTNLLIFGVIGAIIQFVGGPNRQLGVLLGNGLLIFNLKAGIFGFIALAIRAIIMKTQDKSFQDKAQVFAAGLIAGTALYSFFNSTVRIIGAKK